MSYRYLEDIATADAAFEVKGRTVKELFRDAAIATFEVMVDTKSVEPEITREIELNNEAVDNLFFDWLSELVYLKDADALLFSKFDVSIKKMIPMSSRQRQRVRPSTRKNTYSGLM